MKLNSIGIKAQPFRDDIFPSIEEQYTGRINCFASSEKIRLFYERGYLNLKDIIKSNQIEWFTNLFLNIKALDAPDQSVLARYDGEKIVPLVFSESSPYGIHAKKAGQHMALEALLMSAEEAPIVILKGSAGTGKTLLSLACALEKTIEVHDKRYSQILVTTPIETLREENLGFLPGALEQKFNPYLGGIMDNLTLLMGGKKKNSKSQNSKSKIPKHNHGSDYDDNKNGTIILSLFIFI